MKGANKMAEKKSLTRRQFLDVGIKGGAALALQPILGGLSRAAVTKSRPNILLIITDQQGLETLSSLRNAFTRTPNLDRLKQRGVTFARSYSANPICSPARSSMFTGRMSSETGVIHNGLPIRKSIPNLGQWLSQYGYETVYAGKWHLPDGYPTRIPGFKVLPGGIYLRGTVGDRTVSMASESFLRNYRSEKPFFLVTSLLQPHDVCGWILRNKTPFNTLPVKGIEDQLPPLPPNFNVLLKEAARAQIARMPEWTPLNWRYYLWSYYRMVEEADRELGRVLDALEASRFENNTLVIFTSDHGEGRARHSTVLKNFLYEEAVNVPLIFSFPGRFSENKVDETHLVSGTDIVPTVCDLAGVPAPPLMRGRSLLPVLKGKARSWREFVVSEVMNDYGRMVRTETFKMIAYRNDPTVQLFDIKNDPWETRNLADDPRYRNELQELKRLLASWEQKLKPAPNALGPFVMK